MTTLLVLRSTCLLRCRQQQYLIKEVLKCSLNDVSLRSHGHAGRSKSPSVVAALYSRNFSSDSEDPFDKYRDFNISKDTWHEMEIESKRTLQSIRPDIYHEVLNEIIEASETFPAPVPELGPTGKFKYQTQNLADGNLGYVRNATGGHPDNNKSTEVVLQISTNEYNIQAMSLSVDESMIACLLESLDERQMSSSMILLKHIQSGKEVKVKLEQLQEKLSQTIHGIASIEWGPIQQDGSHSLYFVTTDMVGRPCTVYASRIHHNEATDFIATSTNKVIHYNDHATMVDVQRTKGCQYVAIHGTTKTTNEIHLDQYLDQAPILVRRGEEDVLYHIDVGVEDDIFLLSSSSTGKYGLGLDYSIYHTTINHLPLKNTFFGHPIELDESQSKHNDSSFLIEDMDLFNSALVLYERSRLTGQQQLRIFNRHEKEDHVSVVRLDDLQQQECGSLSPCGNVHFHATSLRFMVDSPVSVGSTWEYDFSLNELRRQVDHNDDVAKYTDTAKDYVQKRLTVTSHDGTEVPLSLVHHKKVDMESSPSTILMGYGSYGQPMNLSFDPSYVPLLQRGFVLAFAHTRGGGDLGKEWYHRGRLLDKKNAIQDYLACARALERHRLTARAFSAGGVVIGAALNEEPSLFRCVVLTNAFLDVAKTMENPNLHLTEHEWDEFGNPIANEDAREAIASYCPVSNVDAAATIPDCLVIGTCDDERVPFWNALIYGRKLQEGLPPTTRSNNPVYLFFEKTGGHHLAGSRLPVAAMEVAFIIASNATDRTNPQETKN